MNDMKPCPFCGAELEKKKSPHWGRNFENKLAVIGYDDYWSHPVNDCIICMGSPEGFCVFGDGIEEWNRRVDDK